MLHIDQKPASFDVLVATPAGIGGQGVGAIRGVWQAAAR